MICDKEYPLPSQVKPNYPPALERIVMRALAKKREDRYQSAREMQADLETFAREERIAVSQVSLTKWMESSSPTSSRSRKRRCKTPSSSPT